MGLGFQNLLICSAMIFNNLPSVQPAERLKLIDRLTKLGYPQATNLYNFGVRHPEYLRYMTDAEILAISGINNSALTTIRSKAGSFKIWKDE